MDQGQAIDQLRAWVDQQRIEGVAAISDCVRNDQPCLYVYVTSPDAAAKLPKVFQGFDVIVDQGDPIHALEKPSPPQR